PAAREFCPINSHLAGGAAGAGRGGFRSRGSGLGWRVGQVFEAHQCIPLLALRASEGDVLLALWASEGDVLLALRAGEGESLVLLVGGPRRLGPPYGLALADEIADYRADGDLGAGFRGIWRNPQDAGVETLDLFGGLLAFECKEVLARLHGLAVLLQ